METLEQRYLEAVRRLRTRTDHLEEMAAWEAELGSKLWRAQAVLRVTGEALGDMAALEEEVKLFGAVAARLKVVSESQPQCE